jgi:acyl-coenzyme A thioesterase 13
MLTRRATLVDTITTAALVTVSPHTGVSVNLSVTYLSPVPGGSDVEIEARVVRAGRTLATLEADVRAGGQLCARGTHTKFLQVADPLRPPPAPVLSQQTPGASHSRL